MKICSCCGVRKPIGYFYGGRWCKCCVNKWVKQNLVDFRKNLGVKENVNVSR